MGKTIEDKLKNVLSFIVSYTEENGFPPSVREIGANLSIKSTATTYYYLEKLKEQGYLKKTKSKNRAIEVINKNKISYKSVPLIGKVTAGIPITAVENIEEFIPLPSSMFKSNDLFMLSVCGESMIDAGIMDGDLVLVKEQSHARDGDIVVALLEDEATVKRFYKEKDRIRLQPENQLMEPIYARDVRILGKIKGLYRKY